MSSSSDQVSFNSIDPSTGGSTQKIHSLENKRRLRRPYHRAGKEGLVIASRIPILSPEALEENKQKLLEVHRRLCKVYECPIGYFHDLDPLSELISSVLSHRTRNRDSGRAFKALKSRYPSWHELMDAPIEEVQSLIQPVTWPEQKAPRLQAILRQVATKREGNLSLEFLADLSIADARKWLEQLPGVGPKTSAAVLSFSRLRRPALAVDCHHHRVAQRLGLIAKSVAVGPAHEALSQLLPEDWGAQEVYDDHEILMLHGQRCCYHAEPACHRCVVWSLCPEGQRRWQPATQEQGPHAAH